VQHLVQRWRADDQSIQPPAFIDVLTMTAGKFNADVLRKLLNNAPLEHLQDVDAFDKIYSANIDDGISLATKPRSVGESSAPQHRRHPLFIEFRSATGKSTVDHKDQFRDVMSKNNRYPGASYCQLP
jgi:hypothetical protein